MKTKKQIGLPTVNITVNKSRLKCYDKNSDIPKYYLENGQEFEIEIANPTTDVILAKIMLNNKPISQGGLVLKPGERIFLERYLDVAKKFKFETYEVSFSNEMLNAIQNNGDLIVTFQKQRTIKQPIKRTYYTQDLGYYNTNIYSNTYTTFPTTLNLFNTTTSTTFDSDYLSCSINLCDVSNKTIETGRIEEGCDSTQTFKKVNYDFEPFITHTVEYKLLPISHKIITTNELNVRRYCTNCGHKVSKTDKFCGQCGHKL